MCEKCDAINERIAHYQELAFLVSDRATLNGIKELIAEGEAEKAALHPEKKAGSGGGTI